MRYELLRVSGHSKRLILSLLCRDGDAEDALDGHCMAAGSPVGEEAAGTFPCAGIEARRMGIVLTSESRFKARKLNAFRFLCVLLGFGDLPDHA